MTRIFLDESGCTGFKFEHNSSRYYVISLVGFESDEQYNKAEASLAQLRNEFRWHPAKEFKFNKLNHERRIRALTAALDSQFWIYTFTLNKPALKDGALREKHRMYMRVLQWLFDNSIHDLAGSRIELDRCGNRDLYQAIADSLRVRCRINGVTPPTSVRDFASEESAGLQIADLVSGAVNRYHCSKRGGEELYSIVRPRARHARALRFWPYA